MPKTLLIASVLLAGVVPISADQQRVPDPQSRARFGALRPAQPVDPYARLFQAPDDLKKALQEKSASLTPAPKKRIVCGMTVIEVGPDSDPKMGITPPKDPNTRYTMRGVEPPSCK